MLPKEVLPALSTRNALGIITGLVVGKLAGIAGFCWLSAKLGLARLPADVRWTHLIGAALLGGIGFTMSIFITNLALTDPALITGAKMSILTASLLAALLGLTVLKTTRGAYLPKTSSQGDKQPQVAN